ncbi:MAG: cell envelope integrity protein TolA [Nitrospirae bacterium]|nr:cell envelope integrity protein TolA [Nitrospirota bacterium]
MKASGIYSAFTFSLFLHILIITFALFVVKNSHIRKLPSPYIVSLVDTRPPISGDSAPKGASPKVEEALRKIDRPFMESNRPSARQAKKEDNSRVKERVEALQAKRRVEKIVALRKVVTIGSSGAALKDGKTGSGGTSSSGGDYYALVESRIRQQWIFPESLDRDLEAIISIKIAKDGSVTIDRVEKSSGSPLFDRSVLRAINMASPLPPPLKETEIGVRFRP